MNENLKEGLKNKLVYKHLFSIDKSKITVFYPNDYLSYIKAQVNINRIKESAENNNFSVKLKYL